jgi:hypothetical protein
VETPSPVWLDLSLSFRSGRPEDGGRPRDNMPDGARLLCFLLTAGVGERAALQQAADRLRRMGVVSSSWRLPGTSPGTGSGPAIYAFGVDISKAWMGGLRRP